MSLHANIDTSRALKPTMNLRFATYPDGHKVLQQFWMNDYINPDELSLFLGEWRNIEVVKYENIVKEST